jgi:hypothetical protein
VDVRLPVARAAAGSVRGVGGCGGAELAELFAGRAAVFPSGGFAGLAEVCGPHAVASS